MKKDVYDRTTDWLVKKGWKTGSPIQLLTVLMLAFALWILWAGASRGFALWAGAVAVEEQDLPTRVAAAGAWGDAFGGFNALVGAFGFGAVAITLRLQFRAFEKQSADQHLSNFEQNFFRLIDLMRSLREGLKYTHTPGFELENAEYYSTETFSGHKAIESAYREVTYWSFKNHQGKKIRRSILSSTYDNYVHNRFEWCFAPYFRIIYTILFNIMNDNYLSEEKKAYFGNILRSQLTSFEIGLLAFNGTSKYSKDLKEFIIYFKLLKYLPQKKRKVLGNVYLKAAYTARS